MNIASTTLVCLSNRAERIIYLRPTLGRFRGAGSAPSGVTAYISCYWVEKEKLSFRTRALIGCYICGSHEYLGPTRLTRRALVPPSTTTVYHQPQTFRRRQGHLAAPAFLLLSSSLYRHIMRSDRSTFNRTIGHRREFFIYLSNLFPHSLHSSVYIISGRGNSTL